MFHGDWILTPQRTAIHRPTATAVVADLHLNYQDVRRRRGDAVPVSDIESELAPLFGVMRRHAVERLIIAGDLFEDAFDELLWRQLQTRLNGAGVVFVGLVPGNHDRNLEAACVDFPLLRQGHALGTWSIHHGDQKVSSHPAVLGHYHPCVVVRGTKIPCYLAAANRLYLPAFSKDAAGGPLPRAERQKFRYFAIVASKVIEVRCS